LTIPALEDVVTWHERDLTQSSAERFILPESNILLDYLLSLICNIVANLRVNPDRMLQNLSLTQGRAMSESVMMALTTKGVNRQEAHELLRKLTIQSALDGVDFKQTLLGNKFILGKLSEKEIDEALNPKSYLGTAIKQAEKFSKAN
jgi:adenylosuccinate lyase